MKHVSLQIEADSIEPIIKFHYDKYSIDKHSEIDYFYLKSIERLINKYDSSIVTIEPFLKTKTFYEMLCSKDAKLPKYGFVYLLIDRSSQTFKIGRTHDFAQRYSLAKRDLRDIIIAVHDDETVEKKLIQYFNKHYQRVEGTKESFNYISINRIRKEFNEIANENKVKLEYKSSKHIKEISFSESRRGLWVSKDVANLIINYYVEKPAERKILNSMLKMIDTQLDKDVYQFIQYDNKYKTNCLYWKFHKYTVIQREDSLRVNGSRLYNSICRAENIKRKYITFKKFMESSKMKRLINEFNELYPNEDAYIWQENKENKYLEGYYIHYLFVHFIVEYLNPKYAFFVSELMFKTYNPGIRKDKIERNYNFKELHIHSIKQLNNIAIKLRTFKP